MSQKCDKFTFSKKKKKCDKFKFNIQIIHESILCHVTFPLILTDFG